MTQSAMRRTSYTVSRLPHSHTPGVSPTNHQTAARDKVRSTTTGDGNGEDVTAPAEQEAPLSIPGGQPHVPHIDSAPTIDTFTRDGEPGGQNVDDANDILSGPNDDVRDKTCGDKHQEDGQLVLCHLTDAVTSTTHGKPPWPTAAPCTRRNIGPAPIAARGQRDSNTGEVGSEEDNREDGREDVQEPAVPRRLSTIPITACSYLARRSAPVSRNRLRRVSQSTSPPSGRGGGNRQLYARRRSDSLDGFIILDDDPIRTPQLMLDTDVASELLPADGINVESFKVSTNRLHVQSGYQLGLTNRGKIVGEVPLLSMSSPVVTLPDATNTSPLRSALHRPMGDLHKRHTEAAENALRPTKRLATASNAIYHTRTQLSFADAIPVPSSSGSGPVILCEVVNYQAVREKAFRSVAGEAVETLFKFYTTPTTMVKSLVLLQNISSQGNNTLELGPVPVGQTEVASNDPQSSQQSSHLARMIRAGSLGISMLVLLSGILFLVQFRCNGSGGMWLVLT
jgi:hypothetical protein